MRTLNIFLLFFGYITADTCIRIDNTDEGSDEFQLTAYGQNLYSTDQPRPFSSWSYNDPDDENSFNRTTCIAADVLAVQVTSASASNFTFHVETQFTDSSSSTGAIMKEVNSRCENCLCASPDCSVKSSSVISIGTDGILPEGVDLACQNGICSFLLSHSLFSYADNQLYFCKSTDTSTGRKSNFELSATDAEKSRFSRVYESFTEIAVSSISGYGFCVYPDLTAACPEFSFSCDAGVEISMDLVCFKRKYPALELSDFQNTASPSNSSCVWSVRPDLFTGYNLSLSIDDKDCREQAVYSGSEIIYSWSFEYLSPLVALGFDNVDLTYTFNCAFEMNETLTVNGTIEPPVSIPVDTFNPNPVPEQPDIFINDVPYDDDAAPVVKSSDIMTFDFSNVFSDLGEYRIDSCVVKSQDSSESSLIISNGCASTMFKDLVTVDPFGQYLKTPPIVYLSSPDYFSIECNLIFCDDCANTESSCPDQGNSEIITAQSVRSMTTSEAKKPSASISVSLSEADLVEIRTNKVVILVDRKFQHLLPEIPEISSSASFLTSSSFLFLNFLSFVV